MIYSPSMAQWGETGYTAAVTGSSEASGEEKER